MQVAEYGLRTVDCEPCWPAHMPLFQSSQLSTAACTVLSKCVQTAKQCRLPLSPHYPLPSPIPPCVDHVLDTQQSHSAAELRNLVECSRGGPKDAVDRFEIWVSLAGRSTSPTLSTYSRANPFPASVSEVGWRCGYWAEPSQPSITPRLPSVRPALPCPVACLHPFFVTKVC